MELKIECDHINRLKGAKAQFSEVGDLVYNLTFEVLLKPGDFERLMILFRQPIPKAMVISSPQSAMDLKVEMVREVKPGVLPVDDLSKRERPEGVIYEPNTNRYRISEDHKAAQALCDLCQFLPLTCGSSKERYIGLDGHELHVIGCELYQVRLLEAETLNLCDTCSFVIATCDSDPTFGNGLGNDNVIACERYAVKPKTKTKEKAGKK